MRKETKEIKNLNSLEELIKALKTSEKDLLDLRVDNSLRKLKNAKSINFKRKDIAVLKTKIHEKELSTNAG